MTKAQVNQLLELSLPERYELAQILWNSLESEWGSLPVSERERKLLDESLESYAADPEAGEAWPDVKAQLLREL